MDGVGGGAECDIVAGVPRIAKLCVYIAFWNQPTHFLNCIAYCDALAPETVLRQAENSQQTLGNTELLYIYTSFEVFRTA